MKSAKKLALRRRGALLALGASLFGCSASSPAVFPTGEEVARLRRPDGVVIDPESAPPPPSDHAATEDGMMTLRAPLGPEVAIKTIRELFRRVIARDVDEMSDLFTHSAQPISDSRGGYGVPERAWDWWRQRAGRLDYSKLSGELLFRENEIEIFRAEDVLDTPPHPAIRTDALDETDIILRVTMLAGTNGLERYFGDTIVFWLRRDGDTFKIYRQLEDFQLQ